MLGSLTPAVTPLLALNHWALVGVRRALSMCFQKLYWSQLVTSRPSSIDVAIIIISHIQHVTYNTLYHKQTQWLYKSNQTIQCDRFFYMWQFNYKTKSNNLLLTDDLKKIYYKSQKEFTSIILKTRLSDTKMCISHK